MSGIESKCDVIQFLIMRCACDYLTPTHRRVNEHDVSIRSTVLVGIVCCCFLLLLLLIPPLLLLSLSTRHRVDRRRCGRRRVRLKSQSIDQYASNVCCTSWYSFFSSLLLSSVLMRWSDQFRRPPTAISMAQPIDSYRLQHPSSLLGTLVCAQH